MMKFVPADEDITDKLADLDLAEVALLLEQGSPQQGDAYDVLRGVLERLADHSRDRRSTH